METAEERHEEERIKTPERYRRVWAQIDLGAIAENMENMKGGLAPETKMLGVVKADGYGHGSVAIARRLENVEYMFGFAVATPEEAHVLREAGIEKPVVILGYAFPYSYEMLAREEIRPTVFRPDSVEMLEEAGRKAGRPVKVHVKVDTGMNRIGIRPDREGLAFVKSLMNRKWIEIEGIYTHFAKSDEADKTNALKQLENFRAFLHMIKRELSLEIPVKHCANSAAILEMPGTGMDLVRAGIAMYGIYPSDEVCREKVRLRPAFSLYSHIVRIQTIERGESVGYGGTFTAVHRMRIATVPVGYADGYPRQLSGRGQVLICGKRADILGRICMDQFMADVSDIPEAAMGDRVVLLGRDGGEYIGAEELEELSGRFRHELFCCFGDRVPRVYTESGRTVACRDPKTCEREILYFD